MMSVIRERQALGHGESKGQHNPSKTFHWRYPFVIACGFSRRLDNAIEATVLRSPECVVDDARGRF
jgi:hypothetical protein